MNIFVVLLICYIIFQLVGGLIFAVMGKRAANNISKISTTNSSTVEPVGMTVPNNSPATTLSYENTFKYGDNNYICSKKIAGNWQRVDAQQSQDLTTYFSFVPYHISDLSRYCRIASNN